MALPQERIEEIPSQQCASSDNCNAPLCPLDELTFRDPWYPDESICTRYDYDWIQNQKRIALEYKRTKALVRTYFNLQMLNAKGISMKGLDPDSNFSEPEQVKKWLKGMPE